MADILVGLPRVVDAILAAPTEIRMNVIDAVLESFRQTARESLTAGQTEELLDEVIGRLRAEVNGRRERPQSRLRVIN